MKKVFDEIEEVDYYRAVISDSKLNAGSPWTANQKTAQGINDYVIKVPGDILTGDLKLTRENIIQRDNSFIKIYKENEIIKVE